MPFTLSHPMFALPLKRIRPKYVSTTGLVLGSMSPDFEYFLRLEPYRTIGHTIPGLFFHAIPISIILAIIFHSIIKELLAAHLPTTFNINHRAHNALGVWRLESLKDWIVFILSVVIGFISHVTMDALTHANGFFVIRYSIFRDFMISNYPLYKILQYGLSVIGLLLIMAIIINHLYKSSPISKGRHNITIIQRIKYWLIVLSVTVATTVLKLIMTTGNNFIGILFVAPITGACLGLLLATLISSDKSFIRNRYSSM